MLNKLLRQARKKITPVDFVVIGDVVLDRIIYLPDGDTRLEVNNDEARLSLPLGAKVPLSEAPTSTPGGNAYNVAVALGKLGSSTQVFTIVGDTTEGRLVTNRLRAAGVDDDLIMIDKNSQTNVSTIISAGNDRVVFSYHEKRTYILPPLPPTKYVYLTSVGEDDVPLYKQLLEAKKQNDFKLVFSPGSRQLNESYSEIQPIVESSEFIIFNREEALRLTNTEDHIEDEQLLHRVKQLGAKNIIMTNGKNGSIALEENGKITRIGALNVKVVENTGAGDTFSATAIALLAKGYAMETALGAAACHAAALVQTSDHFNALLTLEELLIAYHQNKQYLTFNH